MIFFVGFVRVSYFFLRRGKEAVGLIPVNNNNFVYSTREWEGAPRELRQGRPGKCCTQIPILRRFLWLRADEGLPPSASLTIKNV